MNKIKDYIVINSGTCKDLRCLIKKMLANNPNWVPCGGLVAQSFNNGEFWEYAQAFVLSY